MSTQPKPTGEWMAESIREFAYIRADAAQKIADAHNSALASAKAGGWLSQEALDEYAKVEVEHREFQQQLAAGQDKANVRETELICELARAVERLRRQLADERVRKVTDIESVMDECKQLRRQLAAQREKVQTLADALTRLRDDDCTIGAVREIARMALEKVKKK